MFTNWTFSKKTGTYSVRYPKRKRAHSILERHARPGVSVFREANAVHKK